MDVHQLTLQLSTTKIAERTAAELRRPSTWTSGQFAGVKVLR